MSLTSYFPVNNYKGKGLSELNTYCTGLQDVTHDMLLTEASELLSRKKLMCQVLEKARNLRSVINGLDTKLKAAQNDRDNDVQEKEQQILALTMTLENLTASAREENNKVASECASAVNTANKTLDSRKVKLKHEISSMKAELDKKRKDHFEIESGLRKRKYKLKGELGNWIQKYDEDMGWRQTEIEELTVLHEEDLKEIDQLSEHFVKLEKEYDDIMERKEQERLEEERLLEEENRRRRATVLMQALWRGYLVRKEQKAGGGKKTKGKGKKGGKKK